MRRKLRAGGRLPGLKKIPHLGVGANVAEKLPGYDVPMGLRARQPDHRGVVGSGEPPAGHQVGKRGHSAGDRGGAGKPLPPLPSEGRSRGLEYPPPLPMRSCRVKNFQEWRSVTFGMAKARLGGGHRRPEIKNIDPTCPIFVHIHPRGLMGKENVRVLRGSKKSGRAPDRLLREAVMIMLAADGGIGMRWHPGEEI